MSEQEIYLRFIDWLKQHPRGLPEADVLIPLMKAAFTPEEASLLTGIPFKNTNLEELAEIKQMDPAELRQRLDTLVRKGALYRITEGDTVNYRCDGGGSMTARYPFWAGLTDERTKAMAPLVLEYYPYTYDRNKYTTIQHKGFLARPIETTVADPSQLLPYESVATMLETKDYFCVASCPCRHAKNMDPDSPSCEHIVETCLHFDELAHYIVENGLGREITREEALDILLKCAEDGLVYGIGNSQQLGDTICNCCKCCCVAFKGYWGLGHAAAMTPSNYWACSNSELCIGDGLCVKRCPMEAIRLEDSPDARNRVTKITDENGKEKELKNKTGKVAVVNTKLCIGCGVCAYKCPTKSLVLERRDVIVTPPVDGREFRKLVRADIEKGQAHWRKV